MGIEIDCTLKIGDKGVSLQPLIGCHFGSLFQVESGDHGPFLSPVVEASNQEEKSCKIDEPKDNCALVDNNTAQSLTGDEIDAMRGICETYFKKYPTRIGFVRVDSLSHFFPWPISQHTWMSLWLT